MRHSQGPTQPRSRTQSQRQSQERRHSHSQSRPPSQSFSHLQRRHHEPRETTWREDDLIEPPTRLHELTQGSSVNAQGHQFETNENQYNDLTRGSRRESREQHRLKNSHTQQSQNTSGKRSESESDGSDIADHLCSNQRRTGEDEHNEQDTGTSRAQKDAGIPAGGSDDQSLIDTSSNVSIADDILVLKHRSTTYPLHFPAYAIADGDITVGEVRRLTALEIKIEDCHRIKLLYKGKILRDDVRPCRDEGLKQYSEIMCVVSEASSLPSHQQSSSSASEDEMIENGITGR
ncbi:MAG: hypothetical protein Q9226_004816 [Calogaya cf. arnoldii]